MRKLQMKIPISLFFLLLILGIGGKTHAQSCDPGPLTCTADIVCDELCGSCWFCDIPPGGMAGFCAPDPGFCDAISGGNEENVCRNVECIDSGPNAFQGDNPTGCDYTIDTAATSTQCILCEEPRPPTPTPCGNGSCEPSLGENCQNCAIDCLVPGFNGVLVCPRDTVGVLCGPVNGAITFGGPPWENTQTDANCEDGQICTINACDAAGVCQAPVDITACLATSDLCCPPNCVPPADGVACTQNEPNCDIDCRPETYCPFCGNNIIDASLGEQCDGTAPNNCGPEGCNNATCQCNPPIVQTGVCTQGSGCGNNSGNAPGDCSGFTTIGKPKVLQYVNPMLYGGLILFSVAFGWYLKRRLQ